MGGLEVGDADGAEGLEDSDAGLAMWKFVTGKAIQIQWKDISFI